MFKIRDGSIRQPDFAFGASQEFLREALPSLDRSQDVIANGLSHQRTTPVYFLAKVYISKSAFPTSLFSATSSAAFYPAALTLLFRRPQSMVRLCRTKQCFFQAISYEANGRQIDL